MIRPVLIVATALAVFLTLGGRLSVADEPPVRWWKGNLHTHTLWSDGDDFPEMVADWYVQHGYNFLALSDHNVLSQGIRWIDVSEVQRRGGVDALAKYRKRFGDAWVEMRGRAGSADEQVRLKPLDEFRGLVESRQQFLMIPGEEISDRAEGLPVHMNATNLLEKIEPAGGETVREAIANNLRSVQEQAKRTGRAIMVHLNHPNFGYAVTAEDLAAVLQERFFEVYNGHPGVNHEGDAHHAGVERIWDIANTLRIAELNAPPLWGIATDDSHDYHGQPGSHPGRGWVMVRAAYLTPEHLIAALRAGDFYASSGVELNGVTFDEQSGELSLEIAAEEGVTYVTQFIGTRRGFDPQSQPQTDEAGQPVRATRDYSDDVGAVLATVEGSSPRYELQGDELYVRAVVTSSVPHPDPSLSGQFQQAWTQPVGWKN